jgi:hypothetical protein
MHADATGAVVVGLAALGRARPVVDHRESPLVRLEYVVGGRRRSVARRWFGEQVESVTLRVAEGEVQSAAFVGSECHILGAVVGITICGEGR